MGAQWRHWGDKGGEDKNWLPFLKCQWLRIIVLSNRHSPTYESIRDYLNKENPWDKKTMNYFPLPGIEPGFDEDVGELRKLLSVKRNIS